MHTLFIVILLCHAMFFAIWLWFPNFFIPSVPKLGFVNSIHRENRHTCGIYIPLGCIVSTVDAMTIDAFFGKFIKCLFYSLCAAQCALHNHWAGNGDFFQSLKFGMPRFEWHLIHHKMKMKYSIHLLHKERTKWHVSSSVERGETLWIIARNESNRNFSLLYC